MPLPQFDVPTGVINGVNTVFTVSAAYTAGSARVFHNGLLRRVGDADGWTESNPATGEVTLTEAPITGDTVVIYYLDTSAAPDPIVVERIDGVIRSLHVVGTIVEEQLEGLIR